jgi:DNA-binding CsgD family transcriptional regulator
VGPDVLANAVVPMHAHTGAAAWDVYYEPRAISLRTFYGAFAAEAVPLFLGPKAGDIWGITCVDARGRGVVLCAPQGPRRGLPLGRRAWTMAATHIATAYRLRLRAPTPADAVLTPKGKLLHREGTVAGSEKSLAAAVVRRAEALRAASSIGSEAALELWRGLADGQWSIVEEVESDGKHYLVARNNELDTGEVGTTALTALERQVCAMAAAGHAQKLIAYELGIHASRVARYLTSGMTKLGTASVSDLARRFSWLPTSATKGQ